MFFADASLSGHVCMQLAGLTYWTRFEKPLKDKQYEQMVARKKELHQPEVTEVTEVKDDAYGTLVVVSYAERIVLSWLRETCSIITIYTEVG